MINRLRRDCEGEIFSYTYLIDHLQDYANPRGKISRMISDGEIVRVKKGLYVFGEAYRRNVIHRAALANLIYGPSYVSSFYALSYYQLIPERVNTVTSMALLRNKVFQTPFGRFEYNYLNQHRYPVGIVWQEKGDGTHFFIASAEKALADVVAKEHDLLTENKLLTFLIENLRIDEESLHALNLETMAKISAVYGNPIVRTLNETLRRIQT